ncbi:MAG: amidase family protein [Bacilli bacterium]|nr:amidase family protein [Bacilli bacterium]
MIDTLKTKLKTGDELINESIIKAKNSNLNAFVTIINDAKVEDKDLVLSGIPYVAKDNFSTKGILSTASSNSLKDYIPFFDATAIKKLKETGAVNIGKTVMDELGMGETGTTGHTGAVKNPWDNERITGGSSAGSCAAVAAGIVPFALGSDTGGSIRKPSSYCGVVGYKPTYGMISRYGLFALASSFDHVGVITTSVKDAALVVDTIKGIDENDMTSWDSSNINLTSSLTANIKTKKLFYIKEICENNYSDTLDETTKTLELFNETLNKVRTLGFTVDEISIDKTLLNAIYPAYFTIASAEATSNMANLTGMIFGPRGKGKTAEEMMFDHRTNGFSPLIKRKFIIGSYVLRAENIDRYLFNSAKVRKIITDKISDLFKTYDGMILPASLSPAPKADDKLPVYLKTEQYLAIANFGGFPSITIPSGFVNNMPVGINITGNIKDDENLLNIAYNIENILGYKNQTTKGGK